MENNKKFWQLAYVAEDEETGEIKFISHSYYFSSKRKAEHFNSLLRKAGYDFYDLYPYDPVIAGPIPENAWVNPADWVAGLPF